MKAVRIILLGICLFAVNAVAYAGGDGTRTVYASEAGIILDSDVYSGGGTDQTDAIQTILDKAVEWGRLYFVMDGAALISRSLRVHSNTTLFCPDKSCGFFLADGSDCCVITNATWSEYDIKDHDISLIGGVYNNNSPGQVHSTGKWTGEGVYPFVYGMQWRGVENLALRDLTIANQRTFACTIAGWKNLIMENISIDRRERTDYQNQDGIHLFGPGQHAVLRNIYGNVGDDFIAIAPDEVDGVSSIDDVLIDGVWLDDADQAIRVLSFGKGRIDRLTIRNVSGTYRSYGFIINPWKAGAGGDYGNIVIDNVDLRPMKNNYSYAYPFLFKLGGNIESLTLRNVYWHHPEYDHIFCVVGGRYNTDRQQSDTPTKIGRLIVDGLYIEETGDGCKPSEWSPGEGYAYPSSNTYFDVRGAMIGLFILDNVFVRRPDVKSKSGSLILLRDGAAIDDLERGTVSIPCLKTFIKK